MSNFFNVIGQLQTDLNSNNFILNFHNYLVSENYAQNTHCFYLLTDFEETTFDALPIEDINEVLEKVILSPNLGSIEYILPFGRINVNFIVEKYFEVRFFILSFEDFVLESNKAEIYKFVLNIYFRFNLLNLSGGWELGLEEVKNNIFIKYVYYIS